MGNHRQGLRVGTPKGPPSEGAFEQEEAAPAILTDLPSGKQGRSGGEHSGAGRGKGVEVLAEKDGEDPP